MDFPFKNCIVTHQHFSTNQAQKLLQYPHLLTWVLLDLQLLEEEVNKLGEERAIAKNLSRKELGLLNKFTLPKRKREWLGGRFAAKYAASQLFEQIGSQKNITRWSSFSIIADKNGRPFLFADKEDPTLQCDISISHSASMAAAMVVHRGYCGVDIQKVTTKVFKISDRFCTLDEKQILEDFFPSKPEQQAVPLTKLWAAKEALRKASCLSSLPGFLEMELLEITNDPSQKEAGAWSFVFNWKDPAGCTHKQCSVVVVTLIEDYALALTARSDTVA